VQHYTTNNVYWLVDGTNTASAAVDGGSPAAVTNTWYLASTNCEQDVYCRYELGRIPTRITGTGQRRGRPSIALQI